MAVLARVRRGFSTFFEHNALRYTESAVIPSSQDYHNIVNKIPKSQSTQDYHTIITRLAHDYRKIIARLS